MTAVAITPRPVLFILLLCCMSSSHASEHYLDYLFREPALRNEAVQREFNGIMSSLDEREYESAHEQIELLFDHLDIEIDQVTYGQLLADRGIVNAVIGKHQEGIDWLSLGIEAVESVAGPYDGLLIEMLVVLGLINQDLNEFEAAEEAMRRAQHIAHRHGGVYTKEQLPILDHLTNIHQAQGLIFSADREQRFNLKISEQVYGGDSEEIVPILERLGHYFASRGDSIPSFTPSVSRSELQAFTQQYRASLFRESIDLFERAIRILEDSYGPNDLRLVEPLQGLARARLLQRAAYRYAENAMERIVGIVESNPSTDLADRARAIVALGDTYTLTSDHRAAEKYLEAWQLLAQDEDHTDLQNELFGTPTRLYPEVVKPMVLEHQPYSTEPGIPLFADLEFTVVKSGRVASVKVVDANVPNEDRTLLRSTMRASRYRPRIADGEIVETEGLMLHQTYQVAEPPPKEGPTITTGVRIE